MDSFGVCVLCSYHPDNSGVWRLCCRYTMCFLTYPDSGVLRLSEGKGESDKGALSQGRTLLLGKVAIVKS